MLTLTVNPNSVFCSSPNKVSLVVHIAVSVLKQTENSQFQDVVEVTRCFTKNYSVFALAGSLYMSLSTTLNL
jgi:hypothetical protein